MGRYDHQAQTHLRTCARRLLYVEYVARWEEQQRPGEPGISFASVIAVVGAG